jgi:hypothetical protein
VPPRSDFQVVAAACILNHAFTMRMVSERCVGLPSTGQGQPSDVVRGTARLSLTRGSEITPPAATGHTSRRRASGAGISAL